MTPNLRIAIRFLTAKKRSMLMSFSCIILGVGLYVVTQATTSGFQGYFIKTILGTDGAVRIADKLQATMQTIAAGGYNSGFDIQDIGFKHIEGIDYPEQLKATLRTFRNVDAISEVLRGSNITIRSPFKDDVVQVYGINVNDHRRVSDIGSQIVAGSLLAFSTSADGAMLGRDMADRQHLQVGDSFELVTADQTRRFWVRAIYQTGVEDIDRVRLYLNMEQARSLLEKPTGVSYLQVSLHDVNRADRDAGWMQGVLGYEVAAWQFRERTWLQVFKMLSISTGITVSVFALIAGLAMWTTLAMIVYEKTKDIAILRSMGYSRADISMIFLWQAAIVLVVGCTIGCILGAGVTYAVSQVPLQIRGIFAANHLIVQWNKWHYIQAVGISVLMVMVASLVPARRAARLEPGDIIRGTAQ
ncbi:MAG TPA: FtsX-like permease family protein [Opitutaceae bacterium]|jgi:lipoprotein-releasing system permease protein|nr:FtsX-like permease family protein [Opitutaceae bacterium]